jgi:hypothetical protein
MYKSGDNRRISLSKAKVIHQKKYH